MFHRSKGTAYSHQSSIVANMHLHKSTTLVFNVPDVAGLVSFTRVHVFTNDAGQMINPCF